MLFAFAMRSSARLFASYSRLLLAGLLTISR